MRPARATLLTTVRAIRGHVMRGASRGRRSVVVLRFRRDFFARDATRVPGRAPISVTRSAIDRSVSGNEAGAPRACRPAIWLAI